MLEFYENENKSVWYGPVTQLKKLGEELESEHFEHLERVKGREGEIEAAWEKLSGLSAAKKELLEDHLAREIFKEKLRLQVNQHTESYDKLKPWIADKGKMRATYIISWVNMTWITTNFSRDSTFFKSFTENYLNTKESVSSSASAQEHLNALEAANKELKATGAGTVASIKKLGQEIIEAKYETQFSSYTYPPEGINAVAEVNKEKK